MKKTMFKPKLFVLLPQFERQQVFSDITAGILVGIVALPLAIAFGIASGVSPEKGLITAIIGGFVVSFLGGAGFRLAAQPAPSSSLFMALFSSLELMVLYSLL